MFSIILFLRFAQVNGIELVIIRGQCLNKFIATDEKIAFLENNFFNVCSGNVFVSEESSRNFKLQKSWKHRLRVCGIISEGSTRSYIYARGKFNRISLLKRETIFFYESEDNGELYIRAKRFSRLSPLRSERNLIKRRVIALRKINFPRWGSVKIAAPDTFL